MSNAITIALPNCTRYLTEYKDLVPHVVGPTFLISFAQKCLSSCAIRRYLLRAPEIGTCVCYTAADSTVHTVPDESVEVGYFRCDCEQLKDSVDVAGMTAPISDLLFVMFIEVRSAGRLVTSWSWEF